MSEMAKNQDNLEMIEKVFSDAEFMNKLFQIRTMQEAEDAFARSGVKLSEEEFRTMREFLDMMENGDFTQGHLQTLLNPAENRELTDDDLDMVSGGVAVSVKEPIPFDTFMKLYNAIGKM